MSSEPKQQIEDGILAQTPCTKQKKQNLLQKNFENTVPFRLPFPTKRKSVAFVRLFFYVFCLDVRGEFRISST